MCALIIKFSGCYVFVKLLRAERKNKGGENRMIKEKKVTKFRERSTR